MMTGKKVEMKQLKEHLTGLLEDRRDMEQSIQKRLNEIKQRASIFSKEGSNDYYDDVIRREEILLDNVRETIKNIGVFLKELEKSYVHLYK